eukprot:gene28249-37165_t
MTSKKAEEETTNFTVPTLTELCQATIIKMLEDISIAATTSASSTSTSIATAAKSSSMRNRLIHDLCKYLPDNLLEPIVTVLLSMLEHGLITDVVLLSFLVPDRRVLKLNQAVKIRKSIFKQIGMNCPNLARLDLSNCWQVSNSVIRSILQGCPVLEDIVLNNCYKVTDAAFDFSESPFQALVGCLSLEAISLQGCPQITGEIITTLNKNCKRLKYLNLSQCKNVKSPEIQTIFSHNQLQCLNLAFIVLLDHGRVSDVHRVSERGAAVSGSVLVPGAQRRGHQEAARGRWIGGLLSPGQEGQEQKGLQQSISLVWCSQITDECVVALKRIPTLRSVEVSGCGMCCCSR